MCVPLVSLHIWSKLQGQSDDPSYLGCFSDPAENRVFEWQSSTSAMTADVCSELCSGSDFYGTQYSTERQTSHSALATTTLPHSFDATTKIIPNVRRSFQFNKCWCGDNVGYAINGPGDCAMPCSGNSDEICGGSYALSVYSNDPDYLGCWSDPHSAETRLFPILIDTSDDMTTAVSDRHMCAAG
ncbi:unnamed protein product [Ectocarpus sp. CCAP 1310/34]|nr:unnamed protein product [Ectocarpus sp. CCAP 1310/34]